MQRQKPLFWLTAKTSADGFPPSAAALDEPAGLLAAGGDLTQTRLLAAYRRGIFPWYNEGQPILWWSPDPRLVFLPGDLKVSRSLRQTYRRGALRVSFDEAFAAVLQACAEPRPGQDGTWLHRHMIAAYSQLHAAGHAHSVECWQGDLLVGGLYGIAIGRVFFGESMFSRVSDASKLALVHLTERLWAADYRVLDCQVHSPHLERLGAREIPRAEFEGLIHAACALPPTRDCFTPDFTPDLTPEEGRG
jgi:leucyl/phenylalanyl-tRNA--protein transferase